ncbi:MAG: hypothetical protein ACTSRK_10535 [Promethearchaeota archaeon]
MENSQISPFSQFLSKIETKSNARIRSLHHFAKKLWKDRNYAPIDIQHKCLDSWEELSSNMDCKIVPLISVSEDRPITNLIFGSGSFSTGEFQIQQYNKVKQTVPKPPITLQGIVSNKSVQHKCEAENLHKHYDVPLALLDFQDWYHEFIDKLESNPIRATRYWYDRNDEDRPSLSELSRRFKIRQNEFHKSLGELIARTFPQHTAIVSARGYNFQFCSNIFSHQGQKLPHINDTHPADLSFVDKVSHEKLYAGWQSGAVAKMMKDGVHDNYRGSLIEVDYMDSFSQINDLDEGLLLALSEGVQIDRDSKLNSKSDLDSELTAPEIQKAMKIIDDYFYCTLEPTGLLLFWGITDRLVPVVYQDLHGNPVIVHQKAIVVGNNFHSGVNAWGRNLDPDLDELKKMMNF